MRRLLLALSFILLLTAVPSAKLFNSSSGFPLKGSVQMVVVMVQFSDLTWYPWTKTQVESWTNSVATGYYATSYNQFTIQPTVIDWITIPLTRSACSFTTIESQANAVAPQILNYPLRVYIFPSAPCGGTTGFANRVFLNGQYEPMAHEIGHALGLFHSVAYKCAGTCTQVEYGDPGCVMGAGPNLEFAGYQKDKLGWLEGYVADYQGTGRYVIDRWKNPFNNLPKVLRVPQIISPDMNQWVYIEGRRIDVGLSFTLVQEYYLNGSPRAAAGNLLDLDTITTAVKYYLSVGESVLIDGVKYTLISSDMTSVVLDVEGNSTIPNGIY